MRKYLWSIFGNDDDPKAPEWYQLEWPEWRRQFYWLFLRNPLHNLFSYTIGLGKRDYRAIGNYPKDVFAPKGWNRCLLWYKGIPFPFISYYNPDGFVKKFYIGWRPPGGGLGAKLNF